MKAGQPASYSAWGILAQSFLEIPVLGIATAVASKPEANVVFVVDVVYDEFSTWKKHFEGFKDETGFPDPSEKVSTGGNHVRVSSNHNTFY